MNPSEWHELPAGSDISIRSGITYAIIASVSRNYSESEIRRQVPAGSALVALQPMQEVSSRAP